MFAGRQASPPLVVAVGQEAVDEANGPHDGGEQQHLCVETEPRKVDPDLLSIVLPVEVTTTCFCKTEAEDVSDVRRSEPGWLSGPVLTEHNLT